MTRLLVVLLLTGAVAPTLRGQSRPAPLRTEIAPGVHLFSTARYGGVGLDGNSIVDELAGPLGDEIAAIPPQ